MKRIKLMIDKIRFYISRVVRRFKYGYYNFRMKIDYNRNNKEMLKLFKSGKKIYRCVDCGYLQEAGMKCRWCARRNI